MTTPYIGEIRMFGGNFAPYGWALCNGQILQISDNPALFSLIGTIYGGDGITNFALPNLQGRLAVHTGSNFPMGSVSGSETVTLTTEQLPAHPHTFLASGNAANQRSPVNNTPAVTAANVHIYIEGQATSALAPQSIGPDGGRGQPHNNMQPYQCISFIVALDGVYPTPT